MFLDYILPYMLGVFITLAISIAAYEVWVRVTGQLYTPRHARETKQKTQKRILQQGERLVMQIVEPSAKHRDPVPPPTPVESYADLQKTIRVRGSICVRTQDILNGKIDPSLLLEMIFSRARAAGVKITVEAYEEWPMHRYVIMWWPDERPPSNIRGSHTI